MFQLDLKEQLWFAMKPFFHSVNKRMQFGGGASLHTDKYNLIST
jgi:hypothetical protein